MDALRRATGFRVKGQLFNHHSSLHPMQTAVFTFIRRQKLILLLIAAICILSLVINWHLAIEAFVAFFTFIYFFNILFDVFLMFRSLTKRVEYYISDDEIYSVPENEWPTYTIFCPLYKEAAVVPQFIEAMKDLHYPRRKLQILFLLEEDDKETIQSLGSMKLPSHFQIVIVPHSLPKTKPKAMNYGLYFAQGEYMVIYDAEDIPDPMQLKKAILAFRKADPETICVQAKLNFYNSKQNLLTKIFTAEYSLWFDLVLPGLQSINAPIPLGGTSNHFKLEPLRLLKGWDGFNVTEDCDLGIRLSKLGYKTAMFDSTTLEEANSEIGNWYHQRSRWIKGYMQTYLVHMRQWNLFLKSSKPWNLLFFQLTVGGKVSSMFINPLMWIITISYFILRPVIGPFIESFFPAPIMYMGVFSLIFGNFFYMFQYMVGCAKKEFDGLIKYTLLVPLYWIAMSVAAWQALFEIFFKPHYWAKTKHGLHFKFLIPGVPNSN